MDYELFRKLKAAAFPLKTYHKPDNPKCEHDGLIYGHVVAFEPDGAFFVPTLSELIEACQPYFDMLICVPQIVRGEQIMQKGEWEAHGRVDNIAATGETAAESVARLWLALHAKGIV